MTELRSAMENLHRLAELVPRSKKQRYLLSLSEDEFRDRVVRPVFLQQGLTDGRDTCGPSELGKDCYFTKSSELTGTEVVVVQTKRGKITKAATPRDNLDTIVAQLRTALETRIVLTAEKKKTLPIEAFLVASGEINEHARQHIYDQIRDPRLKFVDVETLIPLIDRYMPELWLNIESDALSYFRAICTAIEQGNELIPGGIALSHGNTNVGVLDDTYVSVHVVRTRPKPAIKGRKLPKKSQAKYVEPSFPATSLTNERDRLILLVGDGGSGKSTVLKRIAYDLSRHPIDSPKTVKVPILLRGRDLAADPSRSLLDHAIERVRALGSGLKQPFTADDLARGGVIIMIDGLDEIGSDASTDGVLAMIEQFHSQYRECQIIVTSRPTQYVRTSTGLNAFTPYSLSHLKLVQAEKIIKALAKQEGLSLEDSSEILRRLQEVHGIILSPLIVTIFVATSDVSRRDVPPNITELFKKYTELMLGRWDEGKKLRQQIQAPVKDLVLQAGCPSDASASRHERASQRVSEHGTRRTAQSWLH